MRTEALALARTAANSTAIEVTDGAVTIALTAGGLGLSPLSRFPVLFNGAPLQTHENGRIRDVVLSKHEPTIGVYLPGSYVVQRPALASNEPPVGVHYYDNAAETGLASSVVTIYAEDNIELAAGDETITVAGATTPLASAVYAGDALPGDLAFDVNAEQTGVDLTGTADADGVFHGYIDVTDDDAKVGRVYVQVIVKPAVELLVGTVAIPVAAYRGVAYASPAITVENGTAPYTFTNTGDALPAGLALTAGTGVISGTPTTAGAATAGELTVTDALDRVATIAYSIDVDALVPVETFSEADYPVDEALPAGLYVRATGVLSPYVSYAVVAGALPDGVVLNAATGVFSGTPTVAATFNFTVRATDGGGVTGDLPIEILIEP